MWWGFLLSITLLVMTIFLFVAWMQSPGSEVEDKNPKKIRERSWTEIFFFGLEDGDQSNEKLKEKAKKNIKEELDPNRYEARIAKVVKKEIDDQKYDEVTWLKAFRKARGNKEEAQALYAEYRAQELEKIYYRNDNRTTGAEEKRVSKIASRRDSSQEEGAGENIAKCFSKYFDFEGVAGKNEFWYFYLFFIVIALVAFFIDINLFNSSIGNGPITLVVLIALFFPMTSVSTRRLHDIGKSGWWQLITLTGIGVIVLLFWYAADSDLTLNRKYK